MSLKYLPIRSVCSLVGFSRTNFLQAKRINNIVMKGYVKKAIDAKNAQDL